MDKITTQEQLTVATALTDEARYIASKLTDEALAAIRATKHWSVQWSNYRANSTEATELLASMGYEVDGPGADTGLEALTGFHADDSGYRSRDLDYAKSYSGYRPNKSTITVMTPARTTEKLIAKKSEIEKEIAETQEQLVIAEQCLSTVTADTFYAGQLAEAESYDVAAHVQLINGRKYHYAFVRRGWTDEKYETIEAATARAEKEKRHQIDEARRSVESDLKTKTWNAQDSLVFWTRHLAEAKDKLINLI